MWTSRLKANRRLVFLLGLLGLVITWRFLAAWALFLVVLSGDPGTGISGLVNLGRDGRDPLLLMLSLGHRWKSHAVGALDELGDDPRVIAALSEVVRQDERLRGTALQSLGVKAAPQSLPILKEYGAVEPLTRMGEPGKLALLDIQANYPRPSSWQDGADRRVWALRAVCEAFPNDPQVRERAAKELESADIRVRMAAVKCQRWTLGQGAPSVLMEILKSDAPVAARAAAAGELGKLGDRDGVREAINFLREEDPDAVCAAATALGEIKDDSAIAGLSAAWREKAEGCTQSALWEFLRSWSGDAHDLDTAIAAYWKDKEATLTR